MLALLHHRRFQDLMYKTIHLYSLWCKTIETIMMQGNKFQFPAITCSWLSSPSYHKLVLYNIPSGLVDYQLTRWTVVILAGSWTADGRCRYQMEMCESQRRAFGVTPQSNSNHRLSVKSGKPYRNSLQVYRNIHSIWCYRSIAIRLRSPSHGSDDGRVAIDSLLLSI